MRLSRCLQISRIVMWLTDNELERLTRRKRPKAQAEVLRRAGIPYTMVDGRPVVLKDSMLPKKQKGELVLA